MNYIKIIGGFIKGYFESERMSNPIIIFSVYIYFLLISTLISLYMLMPYFDIVTIVCISFCVYSFFYFISFFCDIVKFLFFYNEITNFKLYNNEKILKNLNNEAIVNSIYPSTFEDKTVSFIYYDHYIVDEIKNHIILCHRYNPVINHKVEYKFNIGDFFYKVGAFKNSYKLKDEKRMKYQKDIYTNFVKEMKKSILTI